MPGSTESFSRKASLAAPGAPQPHLVLLFQGDRLLAPSLRVRLGGLRGVRVGRGELRHAQVTPERAGPQVDLALPDRRVSKNHCRFTNLLGGWMLEDSGSKNGTFVNGVRCPSALLADGDVIEVGHSFFLYRAATRTAPDAPVVEELDSLVAAPGLATLVTGFADELLHLATVARSQMPVVLLGETGTGKELLAAAVHALSGRRGVFQAVNCGAIAPHILTSELFGVKKGAFSGATEDRLGLVRAATGGTLFLDELGDLPPAGQVALLRVLQESEVHPVGAARPVPVDVRLVVATHRPIEELSQTGQFRADLLARIAGFTLRLPPLRERREDLGLLLARIVHRSLRETPPTLTNEAARALLDHAWPQNVRALEKTLLAAATLAGKRPIEVGDLRLPPTPAAAPPSPSAAPAPEDQRAQLVGLLQKHGGNISLVAAEYGKARMQIHRWLKRLGVDAQSFRPPARPKR